MQTVNHQYPSWWCSRESWAAMLFMAIAAFFLLMEHRAHLWGVLPVLLVALCPLVHLLGHGGHHAPKTTDEGRSS